MQTATQMQETDVTTDADELAALKAMLGLTCRKPNRLLLAERLLLAARQARGEKRQAVEEASRRYMVQPEPNHARAVRAAEAEAAAADAAVNEARAEQERQREAAQPAYAAAAAPAVIAGRTMLLSKLGELIDILDALTDAGDTAARNGWTPPRLFATEAPAVAVLVRQARAVVDNQKRQPRQRAED
jgi:hypothetical protein